MKRNLRKYLSGMLSALLFVACILTPVNAHASSGLAVSAGKNFGDGVDTRQDAIDASTAYGNAGYSTVTLQSPTKSDFTSENLSADILCNTVQFVPQPYRCLGTPSLCHQTEQGNHHAAMIFELSQELQHYLFHH